MLEEVVRAAVRGGTIEPAAEGGWIVRHADGRAVGLAQGIEADSPPWAAPLFGFEVDLESAGDEHRFTPLPHTPASERDVALVLPGSVTAAQVEEVMRAAGGSLLESCDAFDEYRSEELAGRSVAWRLVFRDAERTLRDAEVDRSVEKILRQVKEQLGVERRQS